ESVTSLNDVLLQTLDEPDDLGLLLAGHLELIEGGVDMAEEYLPVALVDPHPAMRQLHVAPHIQQRATGGGGQEVDQELLFTAHTVLAAMLPESTQQRIGRQARQQVVSDGRDRVVATQALVETVRHGVLLGFAWSASARGIVPLRSGSRRSARS